MKVRARPSSRTPLFAALRRAFDIARLSNAPGAPCVQDLLDLRSQHRTGRREFLKTLGAGAVLLGSSSVLSACASGRSEGSDLISSPKIVIVGAGMAGLNAAYQLRKAGYDSTIYEANTRVGGRIYTARNVLGPGLSTELGAEFIDSPHEDMLALVAEFGLELLDVESGSEGDLLEAIFFDGNYYTEAQIISEFQELAARIQEDFDSTGEIVDFENEGGATTLDNTSIAEYLDSRGASGWLKELLSTAYVTEYGLSAEEQSCLNLVFFISPDTSSGFEIFGESDERYKIRGGNERIISELEDRLSDQIELGHTLVGLSSQGSGYRLAFEVGAGVRDVDADIVVMCLPFSVLRDVDISVALPQVKTRAIQELGYGTNAKLMLGYQRAVWREQGFSGNFFTDEAFQSGWDNSRLQGRSNAGLTLYFGAQAGVDVGAGTAQDQASGFRAGLDRLFPGTDSLRNGKVARFHWPSFQFSKGSYACYKVGQWTSIAGAEIVPVGNLYFAGEHCSYDFQGFMNGAAETGRRAAESVLASLGVTSGA